jgi:hypothetical protein
MAKSKKGALATISFWAVGRRADTSQIAMKLNDFPPVLMSLESAREIAAALRLEIEANAQAPNGGLSVQSSPK